MLLEKNHTLPRGSLICGQSPIPPRRWAYFDWHLPSLQPCQGPASAVVTGAGKLSLLQALSAAYWNLSLLPPSFPFGALAAQQPLPLLSWPRSWGNTDFYTDSYHDAKSSGFLLSTVCSREASTYISLLYIKPWGPGSHYLHFTDEGTEAQRS